MGGIAGRRHFPLAPLVASDLQRDAPRRLRQRADRHGYLFLPALLARPRIAALRAGILQICIQLGFAARPANDPCPRASADARGLAYDDSRYIELQQRCLVLADYTRLRDGPEIARVLERVSDEPLGSGYGDVLRVSFPDSAALTTEPHQELHYVKRCRQLWVAWIPLHDCPLYLGPLAVATGSHRLGLLPHRAVTGAVEAAGRFAAQPPPTVRWSGGALRSGDVILFHGLTLHRACPNLSVRRLRLSMDFRYGA